MIGAGSVVTRDVPDFAIVYGNPARIRGYVESNGFSKQVDKEATEGLNEAVGPSGVQIIKLRGAVDLRGSLAVCEVKDDLPFAPERFFLVHDVPSSEARGSHAHKVCHQVLFCISGQVKAIVDDGVTRKEYLLNRPDLGLYMPPMIWGTQYAYSQDAVLLVLASHVYNPEDYIRDYDEFLAMVL
jgi:dTDP-4-dehydrorhamnose 3,5-epimerase-like enzyme